MRTMSVQPVKALCVKAARNKNIFEKKVFIIQKIIRYLQPILLKHYLSKN